LYRLSILYLYIGDLDKADEYVEMMKPSDKNNSRLLTDYYNNKANINIWKGQFKSALENYFDVVDLLIPTKDSSLIRQSLYSIGQLYERIGDNKNALKNYFESSKYALNLDLIDFPLKAVKLDPENKDNYRIQFKAYLNEFRQRLPSELLSISEVLNEMFEANATYDTTRLIKASETLVNSQIGNNNSNKFNLGEIYLQISELDKAEKYLLPLIEGQDQTTNGYNRIMTYYYIGRVNEEKGNDESAKNYYLQFLKYWRNADIQLDEIKDAKIRIASLTS
jgi:tetratricopeptide (TPR) repeat protein